MLACTPTQVNGPGCWSVGVIVCACLFIETYGCNAVVDGVDSVGVVVGVGGVVAVDVDVDRVVANDWWWLGRQSGCCGYG